MRIDGRFFSHRDVELEKKEKGKGEKEKEKEEEKKGEKGERECRFRIPSNNKLYSIAGRLGLCLKAK
jgi:hypothetical protein